MNVLRGLFLFFAFAMLAAILLACVEGVAAIILAAVGI